jgi:hypothetical protein
MRNTTNEGCLYIVISLDRLRVREFFIYLQLFMERMYETDRGSTEQCKRLWSMASAAGLVQQ